MNAYFRNPCALILLAGAVGCNPVPAPAPIVIGHVADKSRLDKAGEQGELGIRLALHELTKDPKFAEALGGRAVQVRHTDARNMEAYEAEGVRLVSVSRAVALLGGLSMRESAALDQAQAPLLAFHGQRSGVGKQIVCLGMSQAAQGQALATFVAADAKIKRVVLLSDERLGEWTTVVESLQKTLPADTKVAALRFSWDVKWKDVLERIRSHEPNAIVFAGEVKEFNDWHKEYRVAAFAAPPMVIFAGEDGASRLFDLDSEGKSAVVLATAFLPVAAIEKTQTFAKAYQDAYQSEATVHAALAYDGFRMLAEAIKRAQPLPTPERIREELSKTKDFDGVSGPFTVDADRQVVRTIFVARWQGGTPTHLMTYSPAVEKKE